MSHQDHPAGPVTNPPLATDVEALRELFDESPMPAVISRLRDNLVLAINKRTSELFAMPQDVARGQRATDYYVDPAERQRLANRVSRDGRVDNLRLELRRPNGQTFWALASSRLVTAAGEPAVFTVFTDISDQVAVERAILESDRRLAAQNAALAELTERSADSNAPVQDRVASILRACAETLDVERVSLWSVGPARDTLLCDDLYTRSLGVHQQGHVLERASAPAYFEALERERVIAADDAVVDARTREFADEYLGVHGIGAMLDVPLRQNGVTKGVLCIEHVGGTRVWAIDELQFAIATANVIVAVLADGERRHALARLAESETRARLLVDTAHDAFVGVNSPGTIVAWNAQAERTFGWTAEEAVGRPLADLVIPVKFREAHLAGMRRFHERGEAPIVNQRLELMALHRTGREFPIEITITSPIREEDGFFFGAFLRDISDRRERDDQLRLAKESAEAATRAKSEFLANMSHELRTPLNGVLGYAQLLQRDKGLSTAQREALEAIAKGGTHLLDLINDVLDLSKIEAGRVDIETTATGLGQLATDLLHLVGESARLKGLHLTMTVAPETPRWVMLDGRHVRQVLLNLLSNAIKFTHRGDVSLVISRADDARLSFEVTDTGVGIEPEALSMIFDAFTQTSAGAAAGGTGLGLTISQHLLGMMGGRLQVESERGVGSRFHFSLPLVLAEEAGASDVDEFAPPSLDARLAEGQELSALVTDDSTVNRRILARLLESTGVRVITAAGGLEAIALARKHRPDVVFMDLKMPDLDGLEATRRIVDDPETAGIPVIAVTASAFGNTREAALDAGCIDYLTKPVRADLLFAMLRDRLGVRFIEQPARASAAPSPVVLDIVLRRRIAKRIVDAATLGAVTDLQALVDELGAGPVGEHALGQRIGQLVAQFDFEGLIALASALVPEPK